MDKKLKIRFGIPHHGWLPVHLKVNKFEFNIEASDVPVNPVNILIEALTRVIHELKSEVWWFLEPAGYYFSFEPLADGNVQFTIEFAKGDGMDAKREQLFILENEKMKDALPFWRNIKEFKSHNYVEPHWPETDAVAFQRLTQLIKSPK